MSKSSWVRRRLQKRSREIGGKCRPPGAAQVVLVVKNLPANARGVRDTGSIPGSGRLSGGGHGNSLQYPCLENPLDRGAWWATVCRVTQSQTRLKWLGTHTVSVINPPEDPRIHWSQGVFPLGFPHITKISFLSPLLSQGWTGLLILPFGWDTCFRLLRQS